MPKDQKPPDDQPGAHGMVHTVEGFTIPADPPVQPLKAVRAVFRLLRNKEDTSQVFEITRALSGRSVSRTFARFARSPYGRRVITAPLDMATYLSDFDRLRAMPAGSFGRAYLDFMESGNLMADGINTVARDVNSDFDPAAFPAMSAYFRHATGSHDVWHTLTGYERDALGELCVLAFTRAQIGNDALQLIVLMGMMAIKKENWRLPAIKSIRQANRTGRAAQWLYGVDLVALLPRPLDEVRAALNIPVPTIYRQVDRQTRYALLKPVTKPSARPASSEA
ncbi:MAG: Coq4 family protein [Pseudomonadota bacterium]